MNILKLLKISLLCCVGILSINNNNGYTTQNNNIQNNNRYQLIHTIEWTWNNIPIERDPFNFYNQGRYISISDGNNSYCYDIYNHKIKVYSRINRRLQYNHKKTINNFTELANRIRMNNDSWDDLDNIVHDIFGENYTAYLS